MDRLSAMNYFATAAQEHSFSAAARKLGLSTVAVAKQVAALERELGAVFFERTPRGLLLTSAGNRFLEGCRPALSMLATAEDEVRSSGTSPRGTLVVGVQHVVARGCLTAALPRFHAKHPDVELDLREIHGVTDETVTGMDVMVVLGWPRLEDLVQREVGAGQFVVAAAPAYWTRHGMPTRPLDLLHHNCFSIRSIDGTLMDMWTFRRNGQEESVAVQGWLRASNAHTEAVIKLALAGAGVVRVLDWANRDELASGALVPALADWVPSEAPPVNVIYRPQLRRVARARAFIDFVAALYAEVDQARQTHVQSTQRPAWLARKYGKASNVPTAIRREAT